MIIKKKSLTLSNIDTNNYNMRRKSLMLLPLASAGLAACGSADTSVQRPNIILIVAEHRFSGKERHHVHKRICHFRHFDTKPICHVHRTISMEECRC